MNVVPIGPDDPRFAAWHGAIASAYAEGRAPGWWASLESTRIYFAREGGHDEHLALVALDGDRVVGGAELGLPLDEDLETMSVELGVLPDARRRGVGAALRAAVADVAAAEGRTVAQAEVFVPIGTDPEQWPGVRFAERSGLRCASVEHRFLLDLPVDLPDSPASDLVSWVGPCPEEHLAQWARMKTRMNVDVPTGELTITAREVDSERVRQSDRTMAEQGWTKVRTMALGPDGVARGYTELFVSAHDLAVVVQDDTWVDSAARGQGLGRRLKVANLRQLQSTPGLLGPRRTVQTYCEQDNVAMRRTNAALGFRPVDELRSYEGPMG